MDYRVWCAGLLLILMAESPASSAEEGRASVRPEDSGAALVNPAMGWTMHFYSNQPKNYGSQLEPSDTVDDFPGLSTVYLRVPWACLEPEEGKFNWALFDTPAQRWIAKGKRIGLRVTCSEGWLRFATPEWVRKAGAKGVFWDFRKGPSEDGKCWDPVFDDPVFLQKLDHFLAAMAARYDDNPNVEFVDIGTFGLWGEGHTLLSSKLSDEATDGIVRKHFDLHRKHFKRTQLVVSDDVVGPWTPGAHQPLTDLALSQNISLRDDSILVAKPPRSWFHEELAQAFWPKLPVILEHEHYGMSKKREAWDPELLVKSVEAYHASFMSIHWWPRELLSENRAAIDRINKRLGYRLQLQEISWPQRAKIGQPFEVVARWANSGVAPCYPGGFMALTLKDSKGGIVAVLSDEGLDVRTLATGPEGKAPDTERRFSPTAGLVAPTTRAGTYDLYVSVGRRDGTPVIALPLAGEDGQRRYKIGQIQLEE
jgi:hypothetical protein